MPLLSIPYPSFTPFTTIRSSEVNANFASISTLLNTTRLDDTNLQDAGITRATKLKVGTANGFVINNSTTGAMSELVAGADRIITTNGSGVPTAISTLPTIRGGTGLALTVTTLDVEKVVRVNTAGNALELGVVPEPAGVKIFNYLNFS